VTVSISEQICGSWSCTAELHDYWQQ